MTKKVMNTFLSAVLILKSALRKKEKLIRHEKLFLSLNLCMGKV